MATESISDALLGDLLSDLKLKPWWEKYRGFCFTLNVVVALSMTFILQSGSITCLPDTNRTEVIEDFLVPVAEFVNTYCGSKLPFSYIYGGALALGSCALLIVISSFWLHIPKVIDAFETYLEIQKILGELQFTTEQLKVMVISPITDENREKVLKVRKAFAYLIDHRLIFNLRLCYMIRNFLLCVVSVVILLVSGLTLHRILENTEEIFNCTIPTQEILAINYTSYLCLSKTAPLLLVLAIAFMVGISFHFIFVCIGIWNTWAHSQPEYKHLTPQWKRVGNLLTFINTFLRNSQSINSSFDDFLDFIASSAAQSLSNRLKEQSDLDDAYLIDLFAKLADEWYVLAKSILYYLRFNGNSIVFASKNYNRLLVSTDKITAPNKSRVVENLLSYLYKNKFFELLVSWLNVPLKTQKKGEEKKDFIYDYLNQTMKPNLDVIGQPYEKVRSLLYYALRKKLDGTICTTAAKRLLKYSLHQAYVHCDGKTYSVENFCNLQKQPGFNAYKSDDKSSKLKQLVDDNKKKEDEGEVGLKKIFEIRNKFRGMSRKSKSKDNEKIRSWEAIAIEISRCKFTPWNKEINKFANEILGEFQWEVLVALMSALIVKDEVLSAKFMFRSTDAHLPLRSAVQLEHHVEELSRRDFPGSLLYYALSKRNYQPFTSTAARMLLSATKGIKKTVWSAKNGYQNPIDFVEQQIDLLDDTREELKELIRKAENAPGQAPTARQDSLLVEEEDQGRSQEKYLGTANGLSDYQTDNV